MKIVLNQTFIHFFKLTFIRNLVIFCIREFSTKYLILNLSKTINSEKNKANGHLIEIETNDDSEQSIHFENKFETIELNVDLKKFLNSNEQKDNEFKKW